jgi:uncharacterized protein (DUF1778 family)
MARSGAAKHDRMHLRLDHRTKRALERAAAYEDKIVSAFVLASAASAAKRVIERHETVTLRPVDWDVFYAALLKPPTPNRTLKRAVARFRAERGE